MNEAENTNTSIIIIIMKIRISYLSQNHMPRLPPSIKLPVPLRCWDWQMGLKKGEAVEGAQNGGKKNCVVWQRILCRRVVAVSGGLNARNTRAGRITEITT